MAALTVTPDTGFVIADVTGCKGSLSGNTYTTGILNASCTVTATFTQQFTVSASAGANGSITPASQIKDSGTVASLTVTPNSGYAINSVSGCGGTLSGNTYNTSALTADCSITASFTELFTVTASAVGSGTISPATQEVEDGDTTTLTVTPNSGFIVQSISGCGITYDSGNSYTTAAITADCAVTANFASLNRIIAGGSSTCTILSDGNAKCWGQNSSGQLGVAAFSKTAHGDEAGESPVTVVNTIDLPDVTLTIDTISIGSQHACAILNDKNLYCWGAGTNGQTGLGINTAVDSMTKVDLSDAPVAEVSAGGNLTCARLANNKAYCWGLNSSGELGLGDNVNQNTPTTAIDFSGVDVARIATGVAHACALLANNTVKCWGDNSSGQLGDNNGGVDSNTPSSVSLPGGTVKDLDAGNLFSCVIVDSNVYCWGENGSGQLGNNDGTNTDLDVRSAALDIDGLTPKKLALGGEHACVLTTVGSVYCWGESDAGQTGQNDVTDDLAPLIVTFTGYTVTDISAGGDHTCVTLLPDNVADTERPIRCWGEGGVGQLGLENTSDIGDDEVVDNVLYNLVF
jgi:alpha-tubulin suppressor-like RCC1 family protein